MEGKHKDLDLEGFILYTHTHTHTVESGYEYKCICHHHFPSIRGLITAILIVSKKLEAAFE